MHARRRILGSRSIGERGATGEEYGPLDWRFQQKIGDILRLALGFAPFRAGPLEQA